MLGYLKTASVVLVLVAAAAGQPQRSLSPSEPQAGDFNLLPPGTRLSQVSTAQLDRFFSNTQSVTTLTNCLLKPRSCNSDTGRNLVKQITSLKSKGQCEDCTPEEQRRLNDIIYYFLKIYRDKYPDLWEQALPRVIHIVASLARQ